MADFVCKVADATGHVFSQVEAAQSIDEARQKLADRGLYVYSIHTAGRLGWGSPERKRIRAVGGTDFLIFNQQFNTLIRAGLPILKALDLLSDRVAAPRLRPMLWRYGKESVKAHCFPRRWNNKEASRRFTRRRCWPGEKSGNLSGVLEYYISYQRVTTGLRKKLVAALIYPAILVVAAVSIVSYLVAYVIPQFARLYSDMNITLPLGHAPFDIAHGRVPAVFSRSGGRARTGGNWYFFVVSAQKRVDWRSIASSCAFRS